MSGCWIKGVLGIGILSLGSMVYASEGAPTADALEKEVTRLERALLTHPKEGALKRTALRKALEAARRDLEAAGKNEKRPN